MIHVRLDDEGEVSEILMPPLSQWADRYHPDHLATFVEAPDEVGMGWLYLDGQWTTTRQQPYPTVEDVVAERERRLSLGFDYDFGNGRGVHRIGTTPADMKGWDEVTAAAQAAINLGYPENTVEIVTDTAPVTITMMEWQQILSAAAQFRQPIWAASFALQSMPVIPSDFNSDEWW